MTRETITCPTCGHEHRAPLPMSPSVPWTDDCACRDGWPCVAHALHPEDAPSRPSDEEMERRERAALKAARERFEALKARIENASTLRIDAKAPQ